MRIKTNLPKAIVYREPELQEGIALSFKPNALPTPDDLTKVVYEGGCFLAISRNGTVAYSEKGQTWVSKKLGDYSFNDIEYAEGKYIIVGSNGSNGVIAYSEDLVDWTVQEIEPANENYVVNLYGIMFNGEDYIMFCVERLDQSVSNKLCIIYSCTTKDLANISRIKIANESFGIGGLNYSAVKGNNRLVLIRHYDTRCKLYYTSNGAEMYETEANLLRNYPLYFCFGTFMQGPIKTANGMSCYYSASINIKDWETVYWQGSDKYVPKFICAVHINNYKLFVGEHGYLIVNDVENLTDKTDADCLPISSSATINSAAYGDKGVVCVGNGGIVFYAPLDTTDKELSVEPLIVKQEIYLRQSDNIRMLNVKAVTSRIDGNIIPENIREGVTILGVTGTYNAGNV